MLTIRWDPVAATEHGDPGIRKNDNHVETAMEGLESEADIGQL